MASETNNWGNRNWSFLFKIYCDYFYMSQHNNATLDQSSYPWPHVKFRKEAAIHWGQFIAWDDRKIPAVLFMMIIKRIVSFPLKKAYQNLCKPIILCSDPMKNILEFPQILNSIHCQWKQFNFVSKHAIQIYHLTVEISADNTWITLTMLWYFLSY